MARGAGGKRANGEMTGRWDANSRGCDCIGNLGVKGSAFMATRNGLRCLPPSMRVLFRVSGPQVNVKRSEEPIKSIELQLVRVETCGCAEGYASDRKYCGGTHEGYQKE